MSKIYKNIWVCKIKIFFKIIVRPKVKQAAKARIKNELKSFLLPPVIRSIEMDEPVAFLSEIRQVVIVFVNIIIEEIDRKSLINLVNETYILVCRYSTY